MKVAEMFLDPALVAARKSSQFIVAGRNASSPAPRVSARAASEGASSALLGRILACQTDLETFIDFQSYEKPTTSNAAACVSNLESRITAWEKAESSNRRPNFTAKPNADLSTRMSNIESSVLVVLQYLRKKALSAEADKNQRKPSKNGVTQLGSSRTYLSAFARSGALDTAMGLSTPSKDPIRMEGKTLVLDVMGPERARKLNGGRK